MMLTKSELVFVTLAVQCVFTCLKILSVASALGLAVAMAIFAWRSVIMATLPIIG